jgi:phosphomannomutase
VAPPPLEVNRTTTDIPSVHPTIFKAYDVRGLVPEELDAEGALAIGRAFARTRGGGARVVVGRDMRESGIELAAAFVRGLRAEGVDVIDVGRVSTPIVYFATSALGAAGGAMVTASHNPGAYNGIKLCGEQARPIGIESGLAEVRDLALDLHGRSCGAPRGSERRMDVRERYAESLLALFPARPRLRVAVDCGNGIAGEANEALLAALPLEVERLYFEPDGSFPNHEADPLKLENLRDLREAVRRSVAQLGIAFDGDGDRAVFIDERAEPVPADLMTALLATAAFEHGLLGASTGARVVYDLRSSRAVPRAIERAGGVPVRCRVGHAFMKARMREQGACFGGELSGHYYFRFPAGYVADDGAAAALMVLQAMEAGARPLSELWQRFRSHAQSGEINRRVSDVGATLERVRQAFPDGKADRLDGLTIEHDDWWFNLRPSNTEPLLRLNLEASTRAEMERRRDQLLELISEPESLA